VGRHTQLWPLPCAHGGPLGGLQPASQPLRRCTPEQAPWHRPIVHTCKCNSQHAARLVMSLPGMLPTCSADHSLILPSLPPSSPPSLPQGLTSFPESSQDLKLALGRWTVGFARVCKLHLREEGELTDEVRGGQGGREVAQVGVWRMCR
jgi:hypothetical protein